MKEYIISYKIIATILNGSRKQITVKQTTVEKGW